VMILGISCVLLLYHMESGDVFCSFPVHLGSQDTFLGKTGRDQVVK